MTDKQIIIDGVNVKDCKRRIGKDNYCRYYKRPCAENNYNCIWKKYLRKEQECQQAMDNYVQLDLQRVKEYNELVDLYKAKEQECEELKKQVEVIKERLFRKIAPIDYTDCPYYIKMVKLKQTLAEIKEIARQEIVCDYCNFQGTDKCDSRLCTSFYLDDFCKSLLQKISECEEENEHS